MPATWWPASTSSSTSRMPITPVAPARKILTAHSGAARGAGRGRTPSPPHRRRRLRPRVQERLRPGADDARAGPVYRVGVGGADAWSQSARSVRAVGLAAAVGLFQLVGSFGAAHDQP